MEVNFLQDNLIKKITIMNTEEKLIEEVEFAVAHKKPM